MPLHADEVEIDADLVRGLVDRQFPAWRRHGLAPVAAFGTDHRLFRLGDRLVVRMPVYPASADQAVDGATWLPRLAPRLPVAVPVPVAVGEPDETYPFSWSVVPWLPGRSLEQVDVDRERLAEDLAAFVVALRAVDPRGGPPKTGSSRGAPLVLDPAVDAQIAGLAGRIDTRRALRVWHAALDAGPWPDEPVWIHGDLLEGNLLVRAGRLSAVIDWGSPGIGDPAPDVAPAWTLFAGPTRRVYRDLLAVDDATWARARAWVMLPALTGVDYYATSVPAFAARSRRHLEAVLGDPDVS